MQKGTFSAAARQEQDCGVVEQRHPRGFAQPANLQKMQRYFRMAREVLGELDEVVTADLDSYLPPRRNFTPAIPHIILAPGGKLPSQCWPYFGELANWLAEREVKTTWIGSADEAELIEGLRCGEQGSMLGADLCEVQSVIQDATVLVCNDSGMLHLAVWCGIPVIAICGPGFAARWTGYPRDRAVQIYFDVSPSGPETPQYRLQCLAGIPVERVVDEILSFLPGSAERSLP